MASLPLIIGHRGASWDAPENTLGAFRLAFTQDADGIEADFRLTSDGAIVCLHDDRTGRTGSADLEVRKTPLEQLRTVDVGRWRGEPWCGEPIPTLGEVLDALPPEKRIYVELKSGVEMVPELAAVVGACRVEPDRIRFLSFDAALIGSVKKRLPEFRSCWLTDYRWRGGWHPSPERVLATLKEIGADGLASRGRAVLDADLVRRLRDAAMEIHVWTVDDAKAAQAFAALGVDSIMTNRPGWLRRALCGSSGSAAGFGGSR